MTAGVTIFKADDFSEVGEFSNKFLYCASGYQSADNVANVTEKMIKPEKYANTKKADRLFYFVIPPSAFFTVAETLKKRAMNQAA